MPRAIRFHAYGGPEVLRCEEVGVPAPLAGEIRIEQRAIGVNYIDTYHRSGLYPLPLPATCGSEAAGVVEAVGEGVSGFSIGDRVAYASPPIGAYADVRNFPADRAVKLPDGISFEDAAAVLLKGMTVHYLIKRTFPVSSGMTVLFHAAAGGVGLLACQWLASLGVRVIGTVGTAEKAELARAHGCAHPIVYTHQDFVKEVRSLTEGKGVPVVFDSVGAATFEGSLESLSPLGMMVSFGNASGPVAPFPPALLADKGSLFLTRPSLHTYTAAREDLVAAASDVFEALAAGTIGAAIGQRFPLADAAAAHRALESRTTTGATVLLT